MKKLIVLSGVPGSGKSTWAYKYSLANKNVYIISSDEIRYEITGSRQDFSKQKEVWVTFSKRIHEYAKKADDVTVILDSLCDLNRLRRMYVIENPEFDEYELVLFNRPIEFVLRHNKTREQTRIVPRKALDELISKFEQPDEETLKLFNNFSIIK